MTIVYRRPLDNRVTVNAANDRVALYVREDDREPSFERQEAALRAYLADHPEWRVVATYRDTTPAPGFRAWRPGLEHALRVASMGEFDTLIVHRIDRLSRRLDDAAAILARLARASVTLRSVNESFDTSTPKGRIIAQIVAVFAAYLRETAMEWNEWERRRNAVCPRGHRYREPLPAGVRCTRRWRYYRVGRRPS